MLSGPSAAGKSRLAAEVIRSHLALADHCVLIPNQAKPIEELPRRLRSAPTVIWMDNLHQYPAGALSRDGVHRLLQDNTALLFLATMLSTGDVGLTDLPDSSESRSSHAETEPAIAAQRAITSPSDVQSVLTTRRCPVLSRSPPILTGYGLQASCRLSRPRSRLLATSGPGSVNTWPSTTSWPSVM